MAEGTRDERGELESEVLEGSRREGHAFLARETQAVARVEPRELISVGDLLAAAQSSGVDAAKAREMYAFAKEVMKDRNQVEWTRAFVAAKMELDGLKIKKDGKITYEAKAGRQASRINYMLYDDIAEAVKPILRNHGLVATYDYIYTEQPPKTVCVMRLMHLNGHVEKFHSPPLPMVDDSGGKTAIQGAGSVGSYGRRYVVCPAFDIVAEGEDDDGNMGRRQPQAITEEQALKVEDIVTECNNKDPRFRANFKKWVETEFGPGPLTDVQLKPVMAKLREKMATLGIK